MTKYYLVESELCPRCYFDNESDRNELALALWQEHIYFLGARTLNWYENGVLSDLEESAAANVFTWECQTYFDVPTQVAWFEGNHYNAGIAYEDYVICACCGGVTQIDEIVDFAPSGVAPIVAYDTWVNVHEEIISYDEASFEYGED